MALTLDDVLEGLTASRRFFLKHLVGLTDLQWVWKPYPECKSVTETLVHLVANDRGAIDAFVFGKEPEYERIEAATVAEAGGDRQKAREMLERSHEQLVAGIRERFGSMALDTEISIWGVSMKLSRATWCVSSEDFYHAGQVAFIRLATDPTWDYYSQIYGAE